MELDINKLIDELKKRLTESTGDRGDVIKLFVVELSEALNKASTDPAKTHAQIWGFCQSLAQTKTQGTLANAGDQLDNKLQLLKAHTRQGVVHSI